MNDIRHDNNEMDKDHDGGANSDDGGDDDGDRSDDGGDVAAMRTMGDTCPYQYSDGNHTFLPITPSDGT